MASVLAQLSTAILNGDVKRLDQLLAKNKLPVNVFLESQLSLLQFATLNNQAEVVHYLLQKGVNFGIVDKDTGATPLHTAAQKGFGRVVRTLLEHGANPNTRDVNGATALHYGTQEGQVEACQILLEKNAPINAKAKFDVTPLHLAASVNQPAICQLLLDHQANPEMTTTKGMTPLHIACFKNNVVILDILIRGGANPKALTTQSQRSGLHFACINGSLPLCLSLLRNGADPNQKDADGKTPIDLAISHNHHDLPAHLTLAMKPFFDLLDDRIVTRILCMATRDVRNFRSITNLLLVCKRWYSVREPVCRQFCINALRCRPNPRLTPSPSSSSSSSSSASGSRLSHSDKRVATLPLQLSNSWTRQASVIHKMMTFYASGQTNPAFILAMGAGLSSPASINTKPALSFEQLMMLEILRLQSPLNKESTAAIAYEPEVCVKTLLEHGTDPNCMIVAAPPQGHPLPTAFQLAVHSRNGILRSGQSVKAVDEILHLLIKAGADSNRQDPQEGNAPLHWAAMKGDESSLRMLVDSLGANINLKNFGGDTPIMIAARNCQWACVGSLFERSADLQATSNNDTLSSIIQAHVASFSAASNAAAASEPAKKGEKPLVKIPSEPLRTTLFTALGIPIPAVAASPSLSSSSSSSSLSSSTGAPPKRARPPAPVRQGSMDSLTPPTASGEPRPAIQRQGTGMVPRSTLVAPKPLSNLNPPSSPSNTLLSPSSSSSPSTGSPGSPGLSTSSDGSSSPGGELRKPPQRRILKPTGQAPSPGSASPADLSAPVTPPRASEEPLPILTRSRSRVTTEEPEEMEYEADHDADEEYQKKVEESKRYAAAPILSPLHAAAMECDATTLFTLLESGENVNQINRCGSSAVHIAAWFGSLPCMRHLINFSADLNLRNRAGDTPYSLARLRGHKDMLDFFHQHYSVHIDRIRGMHLEPLSKS